MIGIHAVQITGAGVINEQLDASIPPSAEVISFQIETILRIYYKSNTFCGRVRFIDMMIIFFFSLLNSIE